MPHFVKYENYWWEYIPAENLTDVTLYNSVGGQMRNCDITGCQTVQAQGREYLDWHGTDVYDNTKFRSGWLAPNGEFYGCEYRSHDALARYVLHKETRSLEEQGYIKITYEKPTPNYKRYYILFNNQTIPTDEQLKYLYNNYSDDRDSYEEMLWKIRVRKLAYEREQRQKNNGKEKE
ncbi:MAG: hypothetical protein E7376_05225 [Clostridiales bacterium]|nr:hypothetical protein [Clostridiales bacterium]